MHSFAEKRGLSLLLSSILYWTFVGIPSTYVFTSFSADFTLDYSILVLSKQLVNGVLYALLAGIVYMLIPYRYSRHSHKNELPRISSRIYYLLNVSIILPSLIVALVFTSRTSTEYQQQMDAELSSTAREVSFSIQNYIETHAKAVNNLALNVKDLPQQRESEFLLQNTQTVFSGFITMLITDENGGIKFGAPEKFYENLLQAPPEHRHVRDRDYYSVPKATGRPYVSNAFIGRGFGSDPIVAVSTPLLDNGEFLGIVEGSLNLPRFSDFERSIENVNAEYYIVITDASDNIVFASRTLRLRTLDEFIPTTLNNRYIQNIALTNFQDHEYLYVKEENDFRWKTYVLTKPDEITRLFYQNLLILIFTLAIISFVFLAITKRFTRQITNPLENLAQIFDKDLNPSKKKIRYYTREVQNIANDLFRAKSVIDKFNKELEEKVASKTSELESLNRELSILAREDELTGLANRRSFNQQANQIYSVNSRNEQQMTLVAIDIDHFKQINDVYGHPFGDECIVYLANEIKRHFGRGSDICARYGGEEFMLLLAGGDCDSHLNQLEIFRQNVYQHSQKNGGEDVKFTVSLGAVCIEEVFDYSFDEVLKKADVLLYKSKEQGRNRINFETL